MRAVALKAPVGEKFLSFGAGVMAVDVGDGEFFARLNGADGVGDVGYIVHAVVDTGREGRGVSG